MTVRIYGAGMAGLLASEMLRKIRPTVYEAQAALPDNHGALLRFRTDAVARETGQRFARVRVLKGVKSDGRVWTTSSLRDANQYSYKVTGEVAARSILDLAPCERFIAPDSFLSGMARDAILRMQAPLTLADLTPLKGQKDIAVISTIPMPVLMDIVGWDSETVDDFAHCYRAIWSVSVPLDLPVINVYQTIYYPEPNVAWYRASITGRKLIVEFMSEPEDFSCLWSVLQDFGLDAVIGTAEVKKQTYGKLLPMKKETERREFILAMTDEYNLYSVGRFATWRQILLDDVVNDVRVVESMITQRSAYLRRLGGFK